MPAAMASLLKSFGDLDYFVPDAKNILVANLLYIRRSVTAFQQFSDEIRVIRNILQTHREAVAYSVIVGSDSDMVNTNELHDVIDVVCHTNHIRIQVLVVFGKLVNNGLRFRVPRCEIPRHK